MPVFDDDVDFEDIDDLDIDDLSESEVYSLRRMTNRGRRDELRRRRLILAALSRKEWWGGGEWGIYQSRDSSRYDDYDADEFDRYAGLCTDRF